MAQSGTITKWWKDKGYGFVRTDGGAQDIFLHYSVINNALRPEGGEAVRFDVSPDRTTGRPRAINVTISRGGNDAVQAMMNMQAMGGYQKPQRAHQNYQENHEYNHGHGHHGGHGRHDKLSKDDEEDVLIRFGALLQEGNEEAQLVHNEFTTSKDMEAFTAAASKLLSGGTKKDTVLQKQTKMDKRNEEQVLIDFGEKLQNGDEKAKEIHEKYSKDSDYNAFLSGARGLMSS